MLKKVILMCGLCTLTLDCFSQTCRTSIVQTTPLTRFILQGNGTVLDIQTKLIWKRCSEGRIWNGISCTGSASRYTWQGALNYAQTLNSHGGFGGKTDWHVPNIKELSSIVELSCYGPAINLTIFPNTSLEVAWSSSPSANIGNGAVNINFNLGNGGVGDKGDSRQVRLVRNTQ